MPATFKGPDVVLKLFNHVESYRKSLRRILFGYKHFSVGINSVTEDLKIIIKLDTEYEKHYKVTVIKPKSAKSSIKFYNSDYEPWRPNDFGKYKREYPRADTMSTPTCKSCYGDGRITCPTCGGAGGWNKTCSSCWGSGSCSSCSGSGSVVCSNCGGRGVVEVKVPYEVVESSEDGKSSKTRIEYKKETRTCGRCGGRGRVACSQCGGSGRCPTCGGSGEVWAECDRCLGSGIITCPLCEGEGELLVYVSDVFEYKHRKDKRSVEPVTGKVRRVWTYRARGVTLTNKLDSRDVGEALGLESLNRNMKDTLENARKAYNELVKNTKSEEFENNPPSIAELKEKIKEDLSDAAYYARRDRVVRSFRHNDIYNKIIAQKAAFEILPVSRVKFRVNGKQMEAIAIGVDKSYRVKLPLFLNSYKIFSLLAGLILITLAYYTTSSIQTSTIWNIEVQSLKDLALFATLLAALFLSFYLYQVILTIIEIDRDQRFLLTIIGDDEQLSFDLFSLIAHCSSYENIGVISSGVQSVLSYYKDNVPIQSLFYTISFKKDLLDSNGRKIKAATILYVSGSSLRENIRDVAKAIGKSHSVILILGKQDIDSDIEKLINKVLNKFKKKLIIITASSNPSIDTSKYNNVKVIVKHNVDLKKIKSLYYKGSSNACSPILNILWDALR